MLVVELVMRTFLQLKRQATIYMFRRHRSDLTLLQFTEIPSIL